MDSQVSRWYLAGPIPTGAKALGLAMFAESNDLEKETMAINYNMSVLIVDDFATMRRIVKNILT